MRKTILTKPIRLFIMLFLIASFFIASPLVILYTMGYRYDFRSGIVKETGVLSIDIEPQDALFFLNDVKIDQRSPIRMTDLIPGTYNLLIKKDGYKDWQKDLVIEKKQTTYIKDVQLFKGAEPDNISRKEIIDAQYSFDGQSALFVIENQESYEVRLLNLKTNKEELLMKTREKNIPKLHWSPYYNYGFIDVMESGRIKRILFKTNPLEISKTYSAASLVETKNIQWGKNAQSPILYTQEDNTLITFTLGRTNVMSAISSYVWFVDENEQVWKVSEDGKQIIYKNNAGKIKQFSLKKPLEHIFDIQNDLIIAKTADNVIVFKITDDNLQELHSMPADNARYNSATKEWIVWSPWEVWSIYKDGSASLHNRTSDPIKDVWPLDEFGVLLLVREHNLTGFNPGYFVSHILFENGNVEKAAVDLEDRKIFFLGSVNNEYGIWDIEY